MQHDDEKSLKSATRPRLARTRFVGMHGNEVRETTGPLGNTDALEAEHAHIADQPTTITSKSQVLPVTRSVRPHLPAFFAESTWNAPLEEQSTAHLMQLSGMMRPVHSSGSTAPLPVPAVAEEDGYWPLGIQQTGPLPIKNLYGREPFGRTMPRAVQIVIPGAENEAQMSWRKVLGLPAVKIALGLLAGLFLFALVARFVDLPQTLNIVGAHLSTPQGIALALLAGITYLAGHSIRGLRWKLFLNPVGQVSTLKVIGLYQVAIFLNFLLPIRAGEVAKSLVLKRIANIPISKSLPTVAMDKALDLVPALVIMVLVPFLGIQMDLQLWLLLALIGAVFVALLLFISLAAWKRDFAVALLQKTLGLLPARLGDKIEGFATGFVDALLAAASRPLIFLPALLLTCGALACDALFALLAFWTIGLPVSFGTVLFGYTLYNMFYILPTPPAQLGSNEAVGLLVFSGLLHLPGASVTAMYIFSHPWAALIMTATGLACLAALGLTLTSAMQSPDRARAWTRAEP
ncbi:MAG TPA: lysylphosphatidylglycerol synthase transmembrane domain-containing protein [Ktedonobacteraceae bacterium]